MSLHDFTVSLERAEVTASAVAVMSAVGTLNGVRPKIELGRQLLTRALLDAVRFAKPIVLVPRAVPPAAPIEAPPALVEPLEERDNSHWEPESRCGASRCKRLMLEILRRAAHDWVLYRGHSKLQYRELAEDAFIWLFQEDEEHVHFRIRLEDLDLEGQPGIKVITSFLSICEALDLDPETVRTRVRQMDARSITAAGRPAETRRVRRSDSESIEEHGVAINVDMDGIDPSHTTHYESYGSLDTPGRLYPSDFFHS